MQSSHRMAPSTKAALHLHEASAIVPHQDPGGRCPNVAKLLLQDRIGNLRELDGEAPAEPAAMLRGGQRLQAEAPDVSEEADGCLRDP